MTLMDPRLEAQPGTDSDRQRADDAWRTFGPPALRFATVLVGPDDAHDIASSAFLRVTRTTRWVDLDKPQSYLFRSVVREAQNHRRQRRRRWRRDLAAVPANESHDDHADVDVIAALSRLSLSQRSVVFLVYWQDMTEAAAAETLGVSASTVHRTLIRARLQLRKALS